jgi:uncharacterized coiled-coil protein SlyX
MGSDPPDLGKGLFGYRKSAVNQVIADRDIMLRQAEGRVRAAEAKIAELEGEVSRLRGQNAQTDEELDQLRAQLDLVLERADAVAKEEAAPRGSAEDAGTDHRDHTGEAFGERPGGFAGSDRAGADFGYPRAESLRPGEPFRGQPREDDVTTRFLTEELAGILTAAEESAARIVERAQASTERQIMESHRLWREVQAEVARFASWRDQVEPAIRLVQSKLRYVRGLVEDVPERIREALSPMADAISSVDAHIAELSGALTPPLLLTPKSLEGEDGISGQPADTYPDQEGDPPGPFGIEAG